MTRAPVADSHPNNRKITALLLSLAPLWSLTVALYKWPEMQRKLAQRRRRELQRALQTSPSLSSQVALSDDDRDRDPRKSTEPTVTVVAVPACERVTPVSMLRPRAVHTHTHGRSRSRSPVPRPSHTHLLSLDHIYLPRSSTEEWNELATFRS